jgi:hypothetical protein
MDNEPIDGGGVALFEDQVSVSYLSRMHMERDGIMLFRYLVHREGLVKMSAVVEKEEMGWSD